MPATQAKEWTDFRVAEVARMTGEGLSASQIGAFLNVTRNAVIGIAHRRGIRFARSHGSHVVPGTPPRPRKPRTVRVHKINIVEKLRPTLYCDPVELSKVNDNALHLSLVDLEHGQCRYPFGNGPFTFCGLKAFDGQSYCELHFAVTHNKTNEPPREKFRVSRFSGHLPVAA